MNTVLFNYNQKFGSAVVYYRLYFMLWQKFRFLAQPDKYTVLLNFVHFKQNKVYYLYVSAVTS